MSYRTRTLIGVAIIELLLIGFYLYTADLPGTTPDAPKQRAMIIGQVMGVILFLTPLLYLMARKNDQKKAERDKGGR